MPSLKNKLSHLAVAKPEVVSNMASQQKSLEALFLEQGFFALSGSTQDDFYPQSCCNTCTCCCDKENCNNCNG